MKRIVFIVLAFLCFATSQIAMAKMTHQECLDRALTMPDSTEQIGYCAEYEQLTRRMEQQEREKEAYIQKMDDEVRRIKEAEKRYAKKAPKVTRSNFNNLWIGMRYIDAVEVMEGFGELVSASEIGESSSDMYLWTGVRGAKVSAMFMNGKLVSKSQLGLH